MHDIHDLLQEKGRDPRFDDRCGKLNQDLFEKSYAFVDQVKQEEREMIEKELKQTKNVQKKEKIKGLLRRMVRDFFDKLIDLASFLFYCSGVERGESTNDERTESFGCGAQKSGENTHQRGQTTIFHRIM